MHSITFSVLFPLSHSIFPKTTEISSDTQWPTAPAENTVDPTNNGTKSLLSSPTTISNRHEFDRHKARGNKRINMLWTEMPALKPRGTVIAAPKIVRAVANAKRRNSRGLVMWLKPIITLRSFRVDTILKSQLQRRMENTNSIYYFAPE